MGGHLRETSTISEKQAEQRGQGSEEGSTHLSDHPRFAFVSHCAIGQFFSSEKCESVKKDLRETL